MNLLGDPPKPKTELATLLGPRYFPEFCEFAVKDSAEPNWALHFFSTEAFSEVAVGFQTAAESCQ